MINKKNSYLGGDVGGGLKAFCYAMVLGSMGVLGGCTAVMEKAAKNVDKVQSSAIDARDQAVANASSSTVTRTARPRLAGEEIILRAENPLPPIFFKKLSYATQGAQTLQEILDFIADATGTPIRTNEIADNQNGLVGAQMAMSPQRGIGNTDRLQFEYTGTVAGLLNELAGRKDLSWRYVARTESIEFYKYDTKTLSVYLPPGAKTVTSSISLSGVGSSSSSTGGSSAVSQNLSINPWASIMSGVQTILGDAQGMAGISAGMSGGSQIVSASGQGGKASANPELGIITITARPAVMERVVRYVNSINSRFSQNVMVDIKIYSLTLDAQNSLGFSLGLLYKQLGDYGVSVVGNPIIAAATGTPGQLTISGASPNWNGSTAVAQALQQFGKVALQTQGQVIAVNGQPSPIQVANEVNYLASSSTTSTPNVGSTSTLTPGTKVVGFTANFLPLILGDNRILLQYQIQLSSLTALTQVSNGTTSIQTPQISSQSLQQQAFVKDGQAVVLFGFDQNRDTIDTAAGIGGGSKAGRSERQMVVIVMQVNGGVNKDV
jgi:type IVB pilus formation R64 PilN family outer membrane protein